MGSTLSKYPKAVASLPGYNTDLSGSMISIDVSGTEIVSTDMYSSVQLSDAPRPLLCDALLPLMLSDAPQSLLCDAPTQLMLSDAPLPLMLSDAPLPLMLSDAPQPLMLSDAQMILSDAPLMLSDAPLMLSDVPISDKPMPDIPQIDIVGLFLAELYGVSTIDGESQPKEPFSDDDGTICSCLCRQLRKLITPVNHSSRVEELYGDTPGIYTHHNIILPNRRAIDAVEKCKNA